MPYSSFNKNGYDSHNVKLTLFIITVHVMILLIRILRPYQIIPERSYLYYALIHERTVMTFNSLHSHGALFYVTTEFIYFIMQI